MNIIIAVDANYGYAKNGSIPWRNKEDLDFFKRMTTDNIIIMGRNTWESLPVKPLLNRINIVISKTKAPGVFTFDNLSEALKFCKNFDKDIYIIGGKNLIYDFLKMDYTINFFLTKLNTSFNCDLFLDGSIFNRLELQDQFEITDGMVYHYTGNFYNEGESKYLLLGKKLLESQERNTRNGITKSLFGEQLEFDVSNDFPLLTTKKMFFRGIVEELLFFISGETNTKILEEKGINIWKGNTSKEFLENSNLDYPEGEMGPMYGYQWRNFNGKFKNQSQGIDQLSQIINEIKTNKTSRRLIMTAFNPHQVNEGVLYPCHSIVIQFYIEENKLSMKMYQRSADYFLGLPFNIASSALLLILIAKECDLIADKLIITLGDIHIYKEHYKVVKEQIERLPYKFPQLLFNNIKKFDSYTFEDFSLINYSSYPKLLAEFKP